MKQDFEQVYLWYNRIDVRYEIIKQLFKREFALLIPSWNKEEKYSKSSTRNLKCHSVQHFDFILRAMGYKYHQQPYNFYKSMAIYKDGIPNQTMNMEKRDNNQWNKEHYNHIVGYDLLIDIDLDSHENIQWAWASANNIKTLFDSCKTPYTLRFSGRGFHFEIPYPYLPHKSFNPKDDDNIYKFCHKVATRLKQRYSDLIDTGIYDSRRLCKLNYTLAIYEKEIYVCYPFNMSWDFDSFSLEDFRLNGFIKPVVKRGQQVFNEFGSIDKLMRRLKIKEVN